MTLEFGREIAPDTHARVMALAAGLGRLKAAGALEGVSEWATSFASLTVHFDPDVTDVPALESCLDKLVAGQERVEVCGRNWRLPVCFEAEFAPDLEALARLKGMSIEAVVTLLTTSVFRVYTIGFLPGFPYMGGLPEALHVPRLETPRTAVPARSIAVAGAMCAAYPWVSPGGWWLLGRTPVPLFDAGRDNPALLTPGDSVCWQGVSCDEFVALEAQAAAGTLDPARYIEGATP
jgi:inhibitor of KinA